MDPVHPLTQVEQEQVNKSADAENYIERVPRAVDIFANEMLGGQMDETISSRMARWYREKRGVKRVIGHVVSAGLNLIERNHGAKAEAADAERARQIIKTEDATGNLPLK